ncbi:hypothetical protein ACI78V_13125 [Geodermatophilus sp. SYSU D00742]
MSDLDAQRACHGDVLDLDVLDETDGTVSLGAAGEAFVHLVRTSAPAARQAAVLLRG